MASAFGLAPTPLHKRGLFLHAEVDLSPAGLPARFRGSLPIAGEVDAYSPAHPPIEYVEQQLAAADPAMLERLATALHDWSEPADDLGREYGSVLAEACRRSEPAKRAIAGLLADLPIERRMPLLASIVVRDHSPVWRQLCVDSGAAALLPAFDRAHDPVQTRPPFGWAADADATPGDPGRALDVEGGARRYLEARPGERARIVELLRQRAANCDDDDAMRRLHAATQLVEVDLASALALADATAGDRVLAPLTAPLARFRTADRLRSHMASLGFVAPAGDDPGAGFPMPATLAPHITFNTETDVFPNGHHEFLADLAALVPALAAAAILFDEIPPPEEDEDDQGWDEDEDDWDDDEDEDDAERSAPVPFAGDERSSGHYLLRAYSPRGNVEVVALACGDWLDLPAMIGLLNQLCAAMDAPERFLVVALDHSQYACVVAGAASALEAAVADRVLFPVEASDAAERGRDFEAAVLRSL